MKVLKCDFGDVDEAMFHDVKRPFERIFHILDIQKSDFGELVGDDLSRRMALRNNNLPLGRLKKRLW
jgi:hypothetical protein